MSRTAPQSPMVAVGPALKPTPGQVDPPAPQDRLLVHNQPPMPPPPGQPVPQWWWLGCHGGAGVSTLATLVPGGMQAGRAWPNPLLGGPSGVLLVCRSTYQGMTAASAAIRQWLAGGLPPVEVRGLIIMADAPGRLPRKLSAQRARLAGTVQRTFFVPWVEEWRFAPAERDTAPKEIARLGQCLRSAPWIQTKGK